MSEIWNGPKKGSRKPKQLRTTSSTSCGEASPSSTQRTASRNSAFWIRLATKPGPSPTTAGRLPMERKNSTSRPTISGAVAAEGMTSTPGVHSGGLNQCIPQKRPGRPTNSERTLMGRDDVLETMTASCGAAEQEVRIGDRAGNLVRGLHGLDPSYGTLGHQPGIGVPSCPPYKPFFRLPGQVRRRVGK